ncbi:MAG: hypothetical protein ACKVOP_04500 [Sphingomonadaceae bacterium]
MIPFRVLLIPLALGACVAPSAPPPPPRVPVPLPPAPAPSPPPAPIANWADRVPVAGIWTYAQDGRGSIARYGVSGGDAVFTLRCDTAARRVFAARSGLSAGRLTLRATTGARAYDAQATQGMPSFAAAIDPRDPQLDAMAFSRGRMLIGLEGAPDLILPVAPEFARVVEDCR